VTGSPWPDRLDPGRPFSLGATADIGGVNFAVFSAHAERIELCLFDPSGRREIARFDLPECTNEVFHGYLPNARAGQLYGYRAHGPYQPDHGHRFNPNKLLLDPYARQLSGTVRWSDALHGYRLGAARGDRSFDRRDSASAMPKAVVPPMDSIATAQRTPGTAWRDTVIYETHVRGFSIRREDIPARDRGTFAALADPRMIDHLVRLGVTAVELLPVHAFLQDRFLVEKGLHNYWGYSTLSFFAPEPGYIAGGGLDDIRFAVRRLHAAGIEVILDVVYNHTCEGSELGTTLSWRGLDNASYYRLVADNQRHTINDTGTGNTLNTSHPRVLQMVLDSLRYWATCFGVDGFRFDLGSTLGREPDGFDPNAGFFDAILQDPVLSRLKLISEPWDIGPGGYQLGNHPPGFGEWNDRFRDSIRSYVRGDSGKRPEIAARLSGSGDIFDHRRRRPWASINFLASHDGFTLHDLVSYAERHNEANGEDNRDGHSDNLSGNWGTEGPTDDETIIELRERVKRFMLTMLMMSQGTPMLLGGDEMGRTQGGNNNAYCQDNETSWFDWKLADEPRNQALQRFVTRLVRTRLAYPVLRCDKFLHGTTEVLPDVLDIAWFDEQARALMPDAWNDAEARLLAVRRANESDDGVEISLLLMNATPEDRDFVLPRPAMQWRLLIDSANPEAPERVVEGETIKVGRHASVVLLAVGQTVGASHTTFGATLVGGNRTHFRLWAPDRPRVTLEIEGRSPMTMRARDAGWHEVIADSGAGARYRYRVRPGLAVPDPAARAQAGDVHEPSIVVDPASYVWRHSEWHGRPWHEAVIYELHVGLCDGFVGVTARLADLASLGVTAIELMPVAEFPGARNWGYDGVLPYAPDAAYGTPDDLKALVDTAHGLGLMVLLDVVYNHFGPDGNYLGSYASEFWRQDVSTPWGDAIDFRREEVQHFFIENALYWLEEFRFDGLRLDALHAIVPQDVVSTLARAIRAGVRPGRHVHLIMEHEGNAAHLLRADPGAAGFDAQWADDFHHCLHVLLTGEHESYYGDFAKDTATLLARCLAEGFAYQGQVSPHTGQPRGEPSGHLPPTAFVVCLQNHDQIGNRAFGERLTVLAEPTACVRRPCCCC
jgi:glycogen operon protein